MTPKQRRFALEYLKDLNATQAAIRAGYSEHTAGSQGERLLRNADIKEFVSGRAEEHESQLEITAERILCELARIGFSDLSQIFAEDGTLLPIHEMPEDARRVLAGIEVEELFEGRGESRERVGTLRKVKAWDKVRALELLGKHRRLFADVVEGRDGGPVQVLVYLPKKDGDGDSGETEEEG